MKEGKEKLKARVCGRTKCNQGGPAEKVILG